MIILKDSTGLQYPARLLQLGGGLTLTEDAEGLPVLDVSSGAGGTGFISGGGTSGKLAKWTGTTTQADSIITDNGATVEVAGNLTVDGTFSAPGILSQSTADSRYLPLTGYAAGQVLYGQAGGTMVKRVLTAGSGITITEDAGAGTLTLAATAVLPTLHCIIPLMTMVFGDLMLPALPAAITEHTVEQRTKVDLSTFLDARVVVRVNTAGNSGSRVAVQYSLDETTWSYLDNTSGPSASLASGSITRDGPWVSLTGAAKADVFLRWVTVGGDGSATPALGSVVLQVRR